MRDVTTTAFLMIGLTLALLVGPADIELVRVQERIMASSGATQFVFTCSPEAREFLLSEGTDAKSGARHLKRAIERHLVFPLSNLIATQQVQLGDFLTIDLDPATSKLIFMREERGALVESVEEVLPQTALVPVSSHAAGATYSLACRATADR